MNRSSGGIGWCIALAVAVLLLLAVLELGKHSWLGWILGILAVVGFVFLRGRGRPAGVEFRNSLDGDGIRE